MERDKGKDIDIRKDIFIEGWNIIQTLDMYYNFFLNNIYIYRKVYRQIDKYIYIYIYI